MAHLAPSPPTPRAAWRAGGPASRPARVRTQRGPPGTFAPCSPAPRRRHYSLGHARQTPASSPTAHPAPTFLSLVVFPPSDASCHPSPSRPHPRCQAVAAPPPYRPCARSSRLALPLSFSFSLLPPSPSLAKQAQRLRPSARPVYPRLGPGGLAWHGARRVADVPAAWLVTSATGAAWRVASVPGAVWLARCVSLVRVRDHPGFVARASSLHALLFLA